MTFATLPGIAAAAMLVAAAPNGSEPRVQCSTATRGEVAMAGSNPRISTAAVEQSKKTAKKGKSSTYPRMGQPPAGTSSPAAKKKPPPEFDYDDDDLPAGNKEKRRPRLRNR